MGLKLPGVWAPFDFRFHRTSPIVTRSIELDTFSNPTIFIKPEGISKFGFWFQFKTAAGFQPEAYTGISRIETARPAQSRSQKTRSYLKKVFAPDSRVAPSSQILDIPKYAFGLTLGRALNSNENPNFAIASRVAGRPGLFTIDPVDPL